MTPADILTEAEAAELMRVRPSTVRALGRRGLIRRIPPARPPRYDRGSVVAYLDRGVYDDRDVEPAGEAQTQAPAPRRRPVRPVEPRPQSPVRPVDGLSGLATWYPAGGPVAAAGPALRAALGRDWRGSRVRVCSGGKCLTIELVDWCGCSPRHGKPTLLDLGLDAFSRLADPSAGVVQVTIR